MLKFDKIFDMEMVLALINIKRFYYTSSMNGM